MIKEELLINTAKPAIESLVNNVVVPKLNQFAKKCRLKYKQLLIPKREHFEEYLYRTYKKYSIINTLVFKNEQRLLTDLYIPLTLTKTDHQRKSKIQTKIDKYPVDLVKEHNKILITDTAGMGKSTITKRLFLDVVENGHGIPVYIEMRRLKKNRTILQEIQEQVDSLSKSFDESLLLDFIQTGGFVFFLDGYDEISIEDRKEVTTNTQDFISKASNNVFFLTSRPEQALTSFGDFQTFRINPLVKKEAYELLRKYDNQGTTSKKLIEILKSGQYEMINEFLQNPLLVSLLFAAFDYKQTIPLKKHIFYRQVYDAYFDSHDLSKGNSYIHEKHSKLDIDDFERILRYIGFKCLKFQKIEFEKDALLKIIDEAKDFCPDLDFSNSDFLNDILTAVPLFHKDGQYYRWVHKSLQEYFAAQFIYKDSKDIQDAILSTLYKSDNLDKYLNLLDLYCDVDIWGFKKNILLPFCRLFADFHSQNHFTSATVNNDDVEKRIGGLFLNDICIMKSDKELDFPEVSEKFSQVFNKSIKGIICLMNENIYISYSNSPQITLFPLISKRQTYLFKTFDAMNYPKYPFATNDIIRINMHSGDDNKNEYADINYYLYVNQRPNIIQKYIDYKSCLNEINSIEMIIKKKGVSSLTDGL